MYKNQFIIIFNINPLNPFPFKYRVIAHQSIKKLQLE